MNRSSTKRARDRVWHPDPAEVRRRPPVRFRLPPRARAPQVPPRTVPPAPRRWLWTCRAGFEAALFEELAWLRCKPRLLGASFVESGPPPRERPAFGRMGFPVTGLAATPADAHALLADATGALQVWAADSDAAQPLALEVAAWRQAIEALRGDEGPPLRASAWEAVERGEDLLQVCLLAPGLAAVGSTPARGAVSVAPGGVHRMRRARDAAPSRAGMKLAEALDWYGVGPGKGERCVDLGSAPGGWSQHVAELGASVWSVDPANLAPAVARHPRIRHYKCSAFDFEPDEPADWLLCDMAWRPIEVAQLIARWGRRSWASHVVANLKLPMVDKLPVIARARAELEDGGWKEVRFRQLYHDRDEVTLTARRV